MILRTENIYKEFKQVGSLKFNSRGAVQEYTKAVKKYRDLAQKLLPRLKAEYLYSGDRVESIEDLLFALEKEKNDPLVFWGSEKTAEKNHSTYVADKEGRLFDKLYQWYEKEKKNG